MKQIQLFDGMPAAFFWLLPLGMANIFCVGACMSTVVLQTLTLANNAPSEVMLLPWLLRYTDANAVAGAAFSVVTLGVGLCGLIAGKLSDMMGIWHIGVVVASMQIFGAVLACYTNTFLIGLVVFTAGQGSMGAVFQTFFSCQFLDDYTTQKAVTYMYAAQSFAYLMSTFLAGLQPFWAGYAEGAALTIAGGFCVYFAPVRFRDTFEVAQTGQHPSSKDGDKRDLAFGFLCVFTFLFFFVFFQFMGGPFVLFCTDMVGTLGNRVLPAQIFLSLNGLGGMFISATLIQIYGRLRFVQFHTKLMMSFVWLSLGNVSPSFPAFAIVLVTVGELHYNPVMLSAISTNMPESRVGLFTGVHFLLCGLGGAFAGLGVPLYRSLGPATYFSRISLVAAFGALGLGVGSPFLSRTFPPCEMDDESEKKALQSAKLG
jgi:MFS family permease